MSQSSSSSSLSDRVQSLRLPPPGGSAPSSNTVPWLLSVIFGAIAVYLLIVGSPLQPNSAVVAPETSAASATQSTDSPTGRSSETNRNPTNGSSDAATAAELTLEAKGYIIPEQQILVSPQVSGRVVELNFEAGQRVEKGFVLAVLDKTEYSAEFDRVKAQLDSARANADELSVGNRPEEISQVQAELSESKYNLEQAERDFLRKKRLFAEKLIQPQDIESAESQYNALLKRVEKLTASAQLMVAGARLERRAVAEAQVRQIQAELRRAQWRLDNCVIVAPISGTILKKNAELGNLVNAIAPQGAFSLCDIADLSKLEVELTIQERDISKVFRGQVCKVRAEAFPKRVYDGVVSRLMPIADRAKGAVPVRVRLTVPAEEEGVYLKPEMGATVQFYGVAPDPEGPSAFRPAPISGTMTDAKAIQESVPKEATLPESGSTSP